MPEWKRQELLGRNKRTVAEIEGTDPLKCDICGKICKSKLGFNAHYKSHKK